VNVNLLIDALVRQTTVLIAQLATAAGARAPLAHTANQVFVELVHELRDQGLGNKVIADMFGLTLRTYHKRMARLSESATDRGRSLWEALLSYIEEHGTVNRNDVLRRFSADDEAVVRGVLKDLVDSGVLFRSGRGDFTTYHVAKGAEAVRSAGDPARVATFAWIAIYRSGPLTRSELAELAPANPDAIDFALEGLVSEGRITKTVHGDRITYSSNECVIPLGNAVGWEAAVFDHFQAMVTAICAKVRLGRTQAAASDWVGGSTYTFEVWVGHPLHDEAIGFLRATRDRAVDLRRRIQAHTESPPVSDEHIKKVIAYVGQNVVGPEEVEGDDE
jgi:hypothetical protein